MRELKIVFVLIFIIVLILGCVGKHPEKMRPTPSPVIPTPMPTPTPTPTPLRPKLLIPEKIDFGEILQDTPVRCFLEVRNTGEAPLIIYNILAPVFINFKYKFPIEVPPSSSALIEFELETNTPKSLLGYLYIYSNDRTSRNSIPVTGKILKVEIREEEWEKEVEERIIGNNPVYVKIEDSKVKEEWRWNFIFPNYVAIVNDKLKNEGRAEAFGELVAIAKDGAVIQGSKYFHLKAGEEKSVSIILDISFFNSYKYELKFKDVTETVVKNVKMLNIVKYVDGRRIEVLDSFPASSEKAKTWRTRDYYNPKHLTYRFMVGGTIKPKPTVTPISPIKPTPTPTKRPVDFEVFISSVNECGLLCRDITASITNVGDFDANNVRIKLELFCNGNKVKVNKKDYLEEYLGIVPARGSVTRSVRLEIGLMDGFCIKSNGVEAVLTIISDKKVKRIEEYLSPQELG